MFRRRVRLALAAFSIAAVAAPGTSDGAAQEPSTPFPTEEELVHRIEALLPAVEEARAAVEAADRRRATELAARPRRATQLVQVGPLRIVAPPGQTELASDLFEEVWLEDFHGLDGSPALEDHVFVFQWAWRRVEPLRVEPELHGATSVQRVELTRAWARTRGAAKTHIRDAVWSALRLDLPPGSPLREWLGTASYPSAQRVSRLVTTAPSDVNGACLGGEPDACLRALGLSGSMTVPPETPTMLLLEAIGLGGEGAWPRLLEHRGAAPMDALAHAAGVEGGAVLASWRDALLDERPEIHAGLGSQAARVILWVLLLAAFAMRSTRWRLA